MTAIVVTALVAIALFAITTLASAWSACRHRFTELRAELRQVERGVTVRYARYDTGPRAAIYHLQFTGQAASRQARPEPALCEAA